MHFWNVCYQPVHGCTLRRRKYTKGGYRFIIAILFIVATFFLMRTVDASIDIGYALNLSNVIHIIERNDNAYFNNGKEIQQVKQNQLINH
jgi:hypothetical protein